MKLCIIFCHKWAKLYSNYINIHKLTSPDEPTANGTYIYDYSVAYVSLYEHGLRKNEVVGKICLKCRKMKIATPFFSRYNFMLLTEELKRPDKRFSLCKNTETGEFYAKEVDNVKNKEVLL